MTVRALDDMMLFFCQDSLYHDLDMGTMLTQFGHGLIDMNLTPHPHPH